MNYANSNGDNEVPKETIFLGLKTLDPITVEVNESKTILHKKILSIKICEWIFS